MLLFIVERNCSPRPLLKLMRVLKFLWHVLLNSLSSFFNLFKIFIYIYVNLFHCLTLGGVYYNNTLFTFNTSFNYCDYVDVDVAVDDDDE